MFPRKDPETLASVLHLSDGDLEEAVDTLISEDEKGTPSPLTSEPLHSVPLGSADQPCSSAMHATSTEVTILSPCLKMQVKQ